MFYPVTLMSELTPKPQIPPQISLLELVAWLERYLKISEYFDVSNNGLQLEGNPIISRLAVAVDMSLHNIEAAVASGADMLLTHHGLFWSKPLMIVGPHAKRVRTALEGNLSLYAAHLPLDAHPEVGNNIMMAKALGLHNIQPFGLTKGKTIGFWGELPLEQGVQDFADRIQKLTGEICLVHAGGEPLIKRVGIISGSASEHIPEAAALGLDTFLTGEPKHATFHDSFEYGINTLYAGHYETEVFGVRALAATLEETFGLPWQFLHQPTGL